MMSQSGQQIITIRILSNISRSKDNQTMKLGQIIEHNMINIFIEKSYTKRSVESEPFIKKSKLSKYLDQQSEML